jgi:hypothetical protein
MTQGRLTPKTDQDRLNELIEFYTKHKPHAGQVIQVRFAEDQLRKFGAIQEAANKLRWSYRGRTLERVGVTKQ